jgi:mannose-1-phosphate guanylyltransferase/mannose-1-phosphate guanylyltransferase/mannose-6-phosphate isomerase
MSAAKSKTKIVPVIMSGGSGTRLWPASRAQNPKQLQALVSEKTMLQDTALRLSGETDDIAFTDPIIICNASHADVIRTQLQDIDIDDPVIIAEPVARNTAPCAAVAALAAQKKNPDALMLLAPADHFIRDQDGFRNTVSQACAAAHEGYLVTFGITATAPETGYGYIQKGEALDDHAYQVTAFKEKPNLDVAAQYIREQKYFWNAGIFLSQPATLLSEMNKHCGDISNASRSAYEEAADRDGYWLLDEKAFATSPSNSIDYAVMEKTAKAAVVEADIGWSDIGSWSSLWQQSKGANGNAVLGDTFLIDTKNSLVHSDGTFVATIGVEDLAIVVKDGAVLVAKMDRVQDIKSVVEELKSRGDKTRL